MAALWKVCASPAAATSKHAPGHQRPEGISRYIRWKSRLTKRGLSFLPPGARPKRVDVPRSRASCPSAESNTSDTINSAKPITLVQRSRGEQVTGDEPDHERP